MNPASGQIRLSASEVKNLFILDSLPHIGFATLARLSSRLSCDICDIPKKPEKTLKHAGLTEGQLNALLNPPERIDQQVSKTIDWLNSSQNHHFVSYNDQHYPPLLRQISRPPLFLFIQGNPSYVINPQIAFVGTRNPTIGAVQNTQQLINELSRSTNAIATSGLARGIDAIVHQSCLAQNIATVAVLGCGINVIYPKRHKTLYTQIAEHGALVSEFLLDTQPKPAHFPRRNRIISGLSLATVVLEAKQKSGSLVTAKYALEQNREVFAVPSSIHNEQAKGCHQLIKQGAKLTESIIDIIDELPDIARDLTHEQKNSQQSLAFEPLLDNVDYNATPIDVIAKRAGMSLSEVLSKLLEYELRGLVASTAEGYIKIGA